MKVLLLNPFLTLSKDDPSQPSPMLSLPYLAAYLEKYNYKVEILDIAALGYNKEMSIDDKIRYGLSESEIKNYINKSTPAIVGITSSSTAHANDVHELAKIVKSVSTEIKVIVGGAHPSSNPERVIKDRNIDIIVKGEGEETFLEIVRSLDRGKDIGDICGMIFRKNGKVIINPARQYIDNLDSIPFPARHLLPMDIYFKLYKNQTNYIMRNRAATMITSRGCPGNCIYCAVKTVWGRRWRGRSPKNVVDEIEELIKNYKVEEIHFLDDSISVNKKRLIEICDEIIKRRLDIKWTTPNGIAVWLLDKVLLKKMKQAGCYRLTFGLESGNKETLNFIGKRYDYDYAKEIIKYAHKLGLWTIGTFIIGFPYEDINSINDTINFAITSYLDFAVFYIANPFPGTKMYEYFKIEGLIPDDESLIIRGVDTKFFTQKELNEIQAQAFSKFLKSRIAKPWRIIPKLKSIEDVRYAVKLAKNLSKITFKSNRIEKEGIAALWRNKNEEKNID
jgi:magnesium-protoporphyrin IX monomethyl ester (oxidative) cyclase